MFSVLMIIGYLLPMIMNTENFREGKPMIFDAIFMAMAMIAVQIFFNL